MAFPSLSGYAATLGPCLHSCQFFASVACTAPPLAVIASSHEAAKALGWPVQTIKTGHDAVIITPGEVAAMLEQIG
jgi:hypothetical protein